jgi:putative PIN family toxin of toxin-antitoxin system
MRAVVDTGVLVSALIQRQGTTGAVVQTLRDGLFVLIYTTDILVEIVDVLGRVPLRTKYHIDIEDITALINLIRLRGELVLPTRRIKACRDANDDKFLEAAAAGQADCVVSGDIDLLVLGSFEGISILRPAEFLARL